jgi:hypothetical protein
MRFAVTIFDYETATLLIVLGLGITELLSALFLGVFSIQNRRRWAWATVVVALCSGYEIARLSPSTDS